MSFSAVKPKTPRELFINNQFVRGTSLRTINVINPSTEEVIDHLSAASAEDVEKAVTAAKDAFEARAPGSWRTMSPADRGSRLWKFAELLEKNKRELALLESMNVGKPLNESFDYDIPLAISTYKYFAGWADKIQGKTIPIGPDTLCFSTHEPLGVVGLIVPWNFPQQILAWKLAPCLAAGNTVVIKPAELTPLSTLYLSKLILEADFPPGVINIIPGFGDEAGEALASHPKVNKISFTGSTKTGRSIQMASAKSNLKPFSLELGGKSAIIVMDDCPNFMQAVSDSFHALFWNSGQCCSAASRIFVHEKIFDKFLKECLKMVESRKLGDPTQPNVEQGPLVSHTQMEQVLEYIDLGVKEGAKLCCGGKRWGNKGFFVQPTIFVDVQDHMKISKEEIFGPVMCLYKFSTLEEALSRANDSCYGLVGAIFTKDIQMALKAAHELDVGLVWVNTYNILGPSIPWGGVKLSGHDRELSEYCLSSFTKVKTVLINHSKL